MTNGYFLFGDSWLALGRFVNFLWRGCGKALPDGRRSLWGTRRERLGAYLARGLSLFGEGVTSQTVLTAFQQVEDELAAIRILTQQLKEANDAVSSARRWVDSYMDQYRIGVVDLTTLLYAQSTLLSSAQSALAVRQGLFVASVILIEALGGGWDASLLPTQGELVKGFSLLPQLPGLY